MRILKLVGLFGLTALLGLASCTKDKEETTQLKIHLTDAPYNASAVNVDIREVRVKLQKHDWISLPTNQGIYNLLEYQNGLDTVVATAVVPLDVLQEVRFVLGDANSIVISGQTYPLTIPSGSESGLKIKLQKALSRDIDSLVADFDAALSIHQEGTGDYKLKPVIKLK
ncbi:DUF4382 domain-containing protein [Pollutibacter soli]|uniref:DUF4382 domain-containing protein n=1 Tax=Pollutibacter soli TaxID=3034157 RepID=UPI0030138105